MMDTANPASRDARNAKVGQLVVCAAMVTISKVVPRVHHVKASVPHARINRSNAIRANRTRFLVHRMSAHLATRQATLYVKSVIMETVTIVLHPDTTKML